MSFTFNYQFKREFYFFRIHIKNSYLFKFFNLFHIFFAYGIITFLPIPLIRLHLHKFLFYFLTFFCLFVHSYLFIIVHTWAVTHCACAVGIWQCLSLSPFLSSVSFCVCHHYLILHVDIVRRRDFLMLNWLTNKRSCFCAHTEIFMGFSGWNGWGRSGDCEFLVNSYGCGLLGIQEFLRYYDRV